ncbi:GNAT family N-acetyltransferase [Zhihengliuella sp.]|uniref:GNAT family N-acetyltransferase n=1 Tax=Zhihengliuella sp. TaxID=1954483 RepID=UPI0028120E6E|nr:GNAT family N-acetyltransferase [Zhihengliuella sp.]
MSAPRPEGTASSTETAAETMARDTSGSAAPVRASVGPPRAIGVDDLEAWSVLHNAVGAFDDSGEVANAVQMGEMLSIPGRDPELDTFSWWDGATMIASSTVSVREAAKDGVAKANLDGGVHPDFRARGLGGEILARGEARIRRLAAARHPGLPVQIDLWNTLTNDGYQELAVAHGYEAVRYFLDMRIDLAVWTPPEPSDHAAEPVRITEALSPHVHRAHLDAFRDHWNFTPGSIEKWKHFVGGSAFRPEFSRLALDPRYPEDPVDAYVLSEEWDAGEIYVALVGTRRRARGRGLASALLTDVVRQARAAGYERIELGVDSDSPTGAVGLYERIGFRPIRRSVEYSKVVEPLRAPQETATAG